MTTPALIWHTETRLVDALIPYEKNPRTLSDKQRRDLEASITKFNLVEIPAINTDNTVIAGHARLKIMKALGRGQEEIEVRVPNRLLTKSEFEEYLLRSNRNTGSWDYELLKAFDTSFLLDIGFDDGDLSDIWDDVLEIEDDEFNEEKAITEAEKTDIKIGDSFALGDHRLICGDSTNSEVVKRLVGETKIDMVYVDIPYNIGLIVDYFGVFDDVAKALEFDEESVRYVITNLNELKNELQKSIDACTTHFHGIDMSTGGYEGLLLAQDCLNTDEKRDAYAIDYSVLSRVWEALSPDPILNKFQAEYTWLSQVYESVRPASGETGRLLWHAMGAQTMKLIHEHIHVQGVEDRLEEIVLDAEVIEDLMQGKDKNKTKLIEIEINKRLLRHKSDPKFVALGTKLEELRDKAERGLINSIEFLKELIELAKETVEAEKEVDTEKQRNGARTALTELFLEIKTDQTPAIVERIVNDVDEIVKIVRFPGWQNTAAGEREVKQALRKTLYKYALHKDNNLFDKAYEYIKQYY